MTILTYCFFSVQYSVSSFRKPTRLQACLALQLPKYMQVGPLLRYSGADCRPASSCNYRSICRLGRCFGIPEIAAGLTLPAFTEVYAGLAAASVFPSRLQACLSLHLPKYMQVWPLLRYSRAGCRPAYTRIYRSISRFACCFGIPEPTAGLPRPAITEVYAGPAAASVFRSLLQACLTLHLPKYMQVWPLLRYSRSVFRTRLKVPLPIRSKRAATDDSSLLALIDLLYFPHALIANKAMYGRQSVYLPLTESRCQISSTYSLIVRSDENLPAQAVFIMAILAQPFLSR